MNNKTAKEIVKDYRIKQIGVIVLYVIALAVLIFVISYNMLLGIVGVIALAMSLGRVFDKLGAATLEKVIFDELDPVKFNEILALGMYKKSHKHQTLGAMGVGDYDRVFQIIEDQLKKPVDPVTKCNIIYKKSAIYFEQHDLKNLAKCLGEFNALKKQFPNLALEFNKYTVFDKFDAFLDEDYEYVIGVCDIDLRDDNPKQQNHKLTKLNVSFYRAVALHDMGELEKAQEAFKEIVEFAPKTHKAALARNYLSKIYL